ncbi:hypothetical protein MY522_22380, partial [Thalassospira xiamenensis]
MPQASSLASQLPTEQESRSRCNAIRSFIPTNPNEEVTMARQNKPIRSDIAWSTRDRIEVRGKDL